MSPLSLAIGSDGDQKTYPVGLAPDGQFSVAVGTLCITDPILLFFHLGDPVEEIVYFNEDDDYRVSSYGVCLNTARNKIGVKIVKGIHVQQYCECYDVGELRSFSSLAEFFKAYLGGEFIIEDDDEEEPS